MKKPATTDGAGFLLHLDSECDMIPKTERGDTHEIII